ncbi:hypothetical protein NLU13_8227 [Sarocladium strictum]|uniref:AB hydrolase-1 domain-containing protein n=1 Tax=Sarocladium strictum TaxID=5046 RepID=A0AA39L4S3_SARSR|nr:hypothetical protein NLU13_8227 [Sarocladium strictum]
MRANLFTTAICVVSLGSLAVAGPSGPRAPQPPQGPHTEGESSMVRSYFYVGGQYEDDGKGEHVWSGQMYVEKLTPVRGPVKSTPIVLIHGKGQSGTNWLNKPDGGRGWASNFIDQGYEVYIVDQPLRARSPLIPSSPLSGSTVFTAEIVQQRFTAAQDYLLWPQAALHTQWPGTGRMGDQVFDAFYSSGVQYISNDTYQQAVIQSAGKALLERIGRKSIVLGHSQAGIFPPLIADAKPELVHALVLLEPTGPQFREAVFSQKPARAWGLTDVPFTYDPPVTDPTIQLKKKTYAARGRDEAECILQADDDPEHKPRRLKNLVDLPILVVTAESSYHAVYDYCTVRYLKQGGCEKTQHFELAKMGIKGNGHMLFMEENSQEIQRKVEQWIRGVR